MKNAIHKTNIVDVKFITIEGKTTCIIKFYNPIDLRYQYAKASTKWNPEDNFDIKKAKVISYNRAKYNMYNQILNITREYCDKMVMRIIPKRVVIRKRLNEIINDYEF